MPLVPYSKFKIQTVHCTSARVHYDVFPCYAGGSVIEATELAVCFCRAYTDYIRSCAVIIAYMITVFIRLAVSTKLLACGAV